MRRMLAVIAIIVCSSPGVGRAATAESSNIFAVPQDCEQVARWYEANRKGVLDASNCRVLSESAAGEWTVVTHTPAGACTYVIKETRALNRTAEGRKRITYHITFVRNISGRLANQDLTIALVEMQDKTEITMSMTTSVTGRFVPTRAVLSVQQKCLAGSERFITSGAR